MFDVLVDHQKKRFYLCICFFSLMIIGSIGLDLIFCFDMVKAEGFSAMIDVMALNANSYYSYFFYSLITSPTLYSYDVVGMLIQTILAFVVSFNVFDWLTVLGLVGFSISHKNKMSKVMWLVQTIYLGSRMVLIVALTLFLYPSLMTNNANMALSRVHSGAFILLIIQVILLFFMGGYLYNVIKLFYLPNFEKAD